MVHVGTAPASAPLDAPSRPRLQWRSSVPFLAVHLVPFTAIFIDVTTRAVALLVGLYLARIFFVTAGYHRLLAHRSFRAGRVVQTLFAFGGTTAAQKGPLWWAAHHRAHHRHADRDGDIHSPRDGFWWSHVGWILADTHKTADVALVADLAALPELRWLDRHDWVGPWTLAVLSFLVGGWSGLVVGFFGSTVLVWHATFAVNSLAHVIGRRRYDTPDTSRNSALVAAVTLGEGWHNNHHRYPSAARQGHAWWEIDPTFLALRLLATLGVVRDLRPCPTPVRADAALRPPARSRRR